jgi:predicted sugar kinase
MPYSDLEKQKEAMRKIAKRHREKTKKRQEIMMKYALLTLTRGMTDEESKDFMRFVNEIDESSQKFKMSEKGKIFFRNHITKLLGRMSISEIEGFFDWDYLVELFGKWPPCSDIKNQ